MTKGLEALEKFDKLVKNYNEKIGLNENDLLGFDLSLKIIEKELKALEIIKKVLKKPHKQVEIENWEILRYISKDEYDLLKEVLL